MWKFKGFICLYSDIWVTNWSVKKLSQLSESKFLSVSLFLHGEVHYLNLYMVYDKTKNMKVIQAGYLKRTRFLFHLKSPSWINTTTRGAYKHLLTQSSNASGAAFWCLGVRLRTAQQADLTPHGTADMMKAARLLSLSSVVMIKLKAGRTQPCDISHSTDPGLFS